MAGATPRQLSRRQGNNLAKVRRYGARLGLVMDNGVVEGSCPSLALGAERLGIAEALSEPCRMHSE